MTPPTARISVWTGERFACIKIVGRANFTSSVDFKTLIQELMRRNCLCFVLDLSECVLMDSTFLGVLTGFGLKLSGGDANQSQQGIELLNPSPRIIELLDTLGVLHFFRIAQGNFSPPADSQPVECAPSIPSRTELNITSLEAHQTLMDVNPANIAKFKDVAQFLAEGLRNSKQGGE
ncbi:MAG: STAS domain-containing protein [Verrucomicrobiota bacterium]